MRPRRVIILHLPEKYAWRYRLVLPVRGPYRCVTVSPRGGDVRAAINREYPHVVITQDEELAEDVHALRGVSALLLTEDPVVGQGLQLDVKTPMLQLLCCMRYLTRRKRGPQRNWRFV